MVYKKYFIFFKGIKKASLLTSFDSLKKLKKIRLSWPISRVLSRTIIHLG